MKSLMCLSRYVVPSHPRAVVIPPACARCFSCFFVLAVACVGSGGWWHATPHTKSAGWLHARGQTKPSRRPTAIRAAVQHVTRAAEVAICSPCAAFGVTAPVAVAGRATQAPTAPAMFRGQPAHTAGNTTIAAFYGSTRGRSGFARQSAHEFCGCHGQTIYPSAGWCCSPASRPGRHVRIRPGGEIIEWQCAAHAERAAP